MYHLQILDSLIILSMILIGAVIHNSQEIMLLKLLISNNREGIQDYLLPYIHNQFQVDHHATSHRIQAKIQTHHLIIPTNRVLFQGVHLIQDLHTIPSIREVMSQVEICQVEMCQEEMCQVEMCQEEMYQVEMCQVEMCRVEMCQVEMYQVEMFQV